MNFLNFLTTGASLFNFNLQNMNSSNKSPNLNEQIKKPQNQPQSGNVGPVPDAPSSQLNPEMRSELMTQQQQLINQYMHMNIQLLNQKLENLEKEAQEEKSKLTKEEKDEKDEKKNLKKTKKINKCGHEERQHYAKGMCNNCYHRYGRTKKPWNCPHQKLYAAGMCQNCYINNYNKKKREEQKNKEDGSSIEPKVEEQMKSPQE